MSQYQLPENVPVHLPGNSGLFFGPILIVPVVIYHKFPSLKRITAAVCRLLLSTGAFHLCMVHTLRASQKK
jgi:hypothetical protein